MRKVLHSSQRNWNKKILNNDSVKSSLTYSWMISVSLLHKIKSFKKALTIRSLFIHTFAFIVNKHYVTAACVYFYFSIVQIEKLSLFPKNSSKDPARCCTIELVKFTAWLSQRHLRKSRNFFARLIYGATWNLLTYWRRPKNAFGVFCQFYDLSLFLKLGL